MLSLGYIRTNLINIKIMKGNQERVGEASCNQNQLLVRAEKKNKDASCIQLKKNTKHFQIGCRSSKGNKRINLIQYL